MQIKPVIDSINYKLGQYVFTEMYSLDNVVEEFNDSITDLWLYQIVWDFAYFRYDNINGTPFLPQTDAQATTYVMPRQIWWIVNAWAIVGNEKIPLTYKKYGDFSNWNRVWTPVYEYYFSGNTIYLSESNNIVVEFTMSPAQYTALDYTNNTTIVVPDDFKWYLKDRTLANMMPIYLSDGQTLADKYYEKSEMRIQRLAEKYGRKYANESVWVKIAGKTMPQKSTRKNIYTEEANY